MSDCFDHEADAWDSLLSGQEDFDDDGYCGSYRPKTQVRCNKCNSTNVYWNQYPSMKWFLFDKGTKTPHKCKEVIK